MTNSADKPKNKTVATLLAVFLGGPGMHRFYLYGARDFFAWNYVIAFILFVVAQAIVASGSPYPFGIAVVANLPLAILFGWVEAFVIGLTPDKEWDTIHNRGLPYQTQSGWPIKALLGLALVGSVGTLFAGLLHLIRLFLRSGIIH